MYALVDEHLEAQLADPEGRKRWLVLDRHPDFDGYWIVEGFSNDYLYDFAEVLGNYRALAPSGLANFLALTQEHEYHVAFFEDPAALLDTFEHYNDPPEVSVQSTFANTVNGMLPFQVQGYNVLKDAPYGVARWDTGCGKTVLAASLIRYHQQIASFDLCFFVVKKNNKVNTLRKMQKLVGIEAVNITGLKARRAQLYADVHDRLVRDGGGQVVVMNYEQFKTDFTSRADKDAPIELTEWGETFFPGQRLLCIWDEMPTKLKSRTSEVYKAICKCLYRTAPPQVNHELLRPASLRSYMLSATPIENSPEDWFNCLRLMDGGRTYGTVTDFNDNYVASWSRYDPNRPETFHNFERMRLKAAHLLHQASKTDPDIAAVFPKAIEEPVYVEWDKKSAAVYNAVQDLVSEAARDAEANEVPIFSLIGTLQMICDAPQMINDSAARREIYETALEAWTEDPAGPEPKVDGSEFAVTISERLREQLDRSDHPKLERLREILTERHADAQVAIYTRLNGTLMPYLEAALQEWGISYGRYAGNESHQQAVQDAFQAGDIRVFLASDSGSDSIDLDAGNVVIDYNLPWKWTTLTQRHNRVHRPTSSHDTVYYYSLIMEGSVEERVLQIIERKRGYHNALFDPAAGDLSASARLSKQDLMYILTGELHDG